MKSPRVLSRKVDDNSLHVCFDITTDLEWFRGHFPQLPVLPGVVQLHWAVQCAREHFHFMGVPREVRRLKYKSVITPPAVIDLYLTRIGPNDVSFRISGADVQHSEGRIRFPEEEA